ncbi:mannitol-1-phosphate 5-dehydrogenase [Paenibacillus silvae]|uniref:mannitol-1-phosphate 5-dehydrogenase n=1 Tax=Paenibacillus silvae TaxID=1325358 RepID=UPI002004D1E4|nr:mannitol-1-phosphate 5-dehydrogenase [Paenibacillus silvae]MCK6075008.1 mannitol-1-phosphate 5-dehydrogenase [Paenibacillus silvae]MCK6149395.1 mannitol-1-phosphate 5-dehydrogenase [Paenibacillus silvae]MCK6267694.1 mannitol-1-phosphate 5-dehydrogenase [Paenibacillus silvae]
MKALHFGAGNIGRGFIGLILSRAGYEVTFSDVNQELVHALQERGRYTVELANESKDEETVSGVTAIDGRDLQRVAEAVAETDLVTTAVGVGVLKHIASGIAKGLEQRRQAGTVHKPLHIIACENAIGGSTQLKEHVYALLDEQARAFADEYVYFPNSAVDRIVPIQNHADPLHVQVEPFYEWVVDRSQMAPAFKPMDGVVYVHDLEPYIERKLFTVNTGHCVAAYIGYVHGYDTIQQAIADEKVKSVVYGALQETGQVLVKRFGFNPEEHEQYIVKILGRFVNPYLTDEVTRVGRSPLRKLSPNDRLVRPALLAYAEGIPVPHLAAGMAAACKFDVSDDPEAVELQSLIREKGVAAALSHYTAMEEGHPVLVEAVKQYHQM